MTEPKRKADKTAKKHPRGVGDDTPKEDKAAVAAIVWADMQLCACFGVLLHAQGRNSARIQ